MNHNRKKGTSLFALLAAALYMISFTSEAATLIPEEELENGSTADVHNMEERIILSDSMEKISYSIENAAKQGEIRTKQLRKEQEEREAEEKAKKKAQKEAEELLASIIFCEAGNQPYKGQVAVGAVILNRVQSSSYPNSIKEVIYQKGQFGPAQTGKLDRVRKTKSYTKSCLMAAKDALSGSNPVEGCLYFGCGKKGKKIGAHYFH